MNATKFLMMVLLAYIYLSMGMSSAQQGPQRALGVLPNTAPHWCEDLGIQCPASFNGMAMQNLMLLETLRHTPPRQFLPDNIADFVLRCELARLSGNEFSLRRLRSESNPIRGVINSLLLFPHQTVLHSSLPPSGASFVVDCTGRHIQMRGDYRSQRDQNRAIRQVFRRLFNFRYMDAFGAISRNMAASAGPRTMASTASVDRFWEQPGHLPRFFLSTWHLNEQGTERINVSYISKAFIANRCFQADALASMTNTSARPVSPATPSSSSAFRIPIRTLQEYRDAMQEIEVEQLLLRSMCESISGPGRRYRYPYNCAEDNDDRLRYLLNSLHLRLTEAQMRAFEQQEIDDPNSTNAERRRHQMRLTLFDFRSMDRTPTGFSDTMSELSQQVQWCRQNPCDCRNSSVYGMLSYSAGYMYRYRNSPEFANTFGRTEFYQSIDTSGCNEGTGGSDPFTLVGGPATWWSGSSGENSRGSH